MNDYMVQVAAIAKAVPGVPVQLIWSREDDIRRDYYRPGGWHSFEAGIGANGELVAFSDHFVTFCDGTTPARAAGFHVAMPPRSEERRVGEEGRSRWVAGHLKKKKKRR